jgi:hypothetical protein
MSGPTAWAGCRTVDRSNWRWILLPAAIGTVALTTLIAGALLLVAHNRAQIAEHVLAPAGIVLLVCSVAQLRIAARLWNRRGAQGPQRDWRSLSFWRRLVVGAFLAYAAALAIGPVAYIEFAILAAIAAWYTVLLLPLAFSSSALQRRFASFDRAGWIGRLAVVAILILATGEGGMRAWKLAREQGWLPTNGRGISPGGRVDVATLARAAQGRPSTEPISAAPLRVAVLGDSSEARSGYRVRVEQALPGVKLIPVRLTSSWLSQPVDEVLDELAGTRAELVLAMLSACEGVTSDAPKTSWFDWRQFELARLVAAGATTTVQSPQGAPARADFEALCRTLAPQLAACRTPIDASMHARWRQTFATLDNLVAGCRRRNLAIAVVLVPGEFQVSRALRETLVRRGGYKAEQVDVELPQRKLACFAAKRQVPLIDLLPSLRLCEESPYERNTHAWNAVGHVAAAQAIGGWLESQYGSQLAVEAQLTSAP